MKARTVLLLFLSTAFLTGCFTRGNSELLEARLQQQEEILLEQQDELTSSKNSIAELQRENNLLQRELAQTGDQTLPPETSKAISRVKEIRIHNMMTGIQNSQENAGDRVLHLVVQPVDADGEIVKVAGDMTVEFQPGREGIILANGTKPVVSKFPILESHRHWHSGFLVSGYQFEIPLEDVISSNNGTVTVRFRTADGREFSTTHKLQD